jgi:hypothetical protein
LNLYNEQYQSLWNADHENFMNVERLEKFNNIKEVA